MGFHGYGHTSCIVGDHSMADSCEGTQAPSCNQDQTNCTYDGQTFYPDYISVSHQGRKGPVDFSKFYTYVPSRGTWSIGGRREASRAQPQMQTQAISSQTPISSQPTTTVISTAVNQPGATLAENKAPLKWTQLGQATPDIDTRGSSPESDGDIVDYGRRHAALIDESRAASSLPPECHGPPNFTVESKTARATLALRLNSNENFSGSPSPQAVDVHGETMRGLDETKDRGAKIGRDGSGN